MDVHGVARNQGYMVGKIQQALEKAGVLFTNGDEPGVRLKKR
jgi:hypothetical protein